MGYVIAKDYTDILNRLYQVSALAIHNGDLPEGGTYATPIPLMGTDVNGVPHEEHHTDRWWFPAPPEKYMDMLPWEVMETPPEQTIQRYYKIYPMLTEPEKSKFKDWTQTPKSVDYKVDLEERLYPRYDLIDSFEGGLLVHVVYYSDPAFTDPVVDIRMDYTLKDDALYNASKTPESRIVTRKWFWQDGELDEDNSKVTNKFYTSITQIREEGKRRRGNIENLSGEDLVKLLMVTETGFNQTDAENLALGFVGKHGSELNNFVKFGGDLMVDTTENETTFPWLDNIIPATFNIGQGDIPIQGLVPKAIPGETIRKHQVDWFKGDK